MPAVLTAAFHAYLRHGGAMLAAALTFYVLLASAPFALFLVAAAGAVFGEAQARADLLANVRDVIGPSVTDELATMLDNAGHGGSTVTATAVGIFFFALATSRVFATVQAGLNHAWEVQPIAPARGRSLGRDVVLRRVTAFLMVLLAGLVFVAFLVLRTIVDVVAAHTLEIPVLLRATELLLGWACITAMCTAVYRVLPDARIAVRDALVGGAMTGALSVVGAFLGGQYAARVATSSPYGAAGSLVAFLLWVYYCAQVFFFGAELTAAWAHHRGEGVTPRSHARRVTFEQVD